VHGRVVAVHVKRIGYTPVKGGRHNEQAYVDLAPAGPVGDRVFCLVDRSRGRVLRTVENPTLLQTSADWQAGVLTVTLPSGRVRGVPTPTGEVLKVDYWGRVAALEVVAGPWAAAYSAHLGQDPGQDPGQDLVLARATNAGEVVYGASVSLVGTAAVDELSRRVGAPVEDAAFRATFTVETSGATVLGGLGDEPLAARTLRIGAAEVEVRAAVPRCAVVDLDPRTGTRAGNALAALAGYRRGRGGLTFGVDAVVSKPGRVRVGDAVHGVERG
jgi:uncharacterized protein